MSLFAGKQAQTWPKEKNSQPSQTRTRRIEVFGGAFSQVFRQRRYLGIWLGLAIVVSLVYSLVLPMKYTTTLSFGNWDFLNPTLVVASIGLGVAMGLVLTLQLYASSGVRNSRSKVAGSAALVTGVLPSLLCCSPIIPTLLGLIGFSTLGIYGTTGVIQGFFSRYENEFLLLSLTLFVASAVLALRKIASASCLSDDGCKTDLKGHNA